MLITSFGGMNLSSQDSRGLALFYRGVPGAFMVSGGWDFDGARFRNREGEPVFRTWDENRWG